jgi:hypothetical protein
MQMLLDTGTGNNSQINSNIETFRPHDFPEDMDSATQFLDCQAVRFRIQQANVFDVLVG